METKVLKDKFGSHNLFTVFEVNENGEKLMNGEKEKKVVSFGIKKAKAVLEHIDDLKKFVEKNDK